MRTFRMCLAVSTALLALPGAAAETYLLDDDPTSGKTWLVTSEISGDGTFEFQPADAAAKPVTHPVAVKANFRYAERRLPPAGRDEAAYRALRRYDEARSEIRVGGQSSAPTLRPARHRIVARADRSGLSPYSPDGPLTPKELELLPSLGDSLLLSALLPGREVSVGQTWNPASWVGPALAGAEVAFNEHVTCRLDVIRDGRATITVEGRVTGASKGAASETTLSGTLTYDLAASAIVVAELTQVEKRSVGPLMPGMSLTLKCLVNRAAAATAEAISDGEAATIPLEAPADALRLEYTTAFGASLICDRAWRPFHQAGDLLILRLLDHGGLVAQCNIAPSATVAPGKRTPERQFQEDIRRSLGDQLTEIVSAEEVKTPSGNAIYRVTAVGKTRDADRVWRYYLVSSPDGRQAAFVFTAEPNGLRRLGERDLDLVTSLKFESRGEPTPARP